MRFSFRRIRLLILLCIVLLAGISTAAAQEASPTNVIIIMDASGSMQALFSDGRSRIAIARDAVIDLVNGLPPEFNASLWAYGHRLPQDDPAASCLDIEQVIPLAPVDPALFSQVVSEIPAIGYTPIARSLELAVTGTPPNTQNVVVLMSDGEESCGGDPCAVAGELINLGFDVVINTIGVAADANTRAQLQCIAQVTSGAYYETNDAAQLTEALEEASVPPPPVTGFVQIVTASGEPVASIGFEVINSADNVSLGSRVGRGELPPGEYLIRVNISPTMEVTATVVAGESYNIPIPEAGTVRLVDSAGNINETFTFTLYDPATQNPVAYSSGGEALVPAGTYDVVINSLPPISETVNVSVRQTVDMTLDVATIQLVNEEGELNTDFNVGVYHPDTGEWMTGGDGSVSVLAGVYDVRINTNPETIMQVEVGEGETLSIPIGGVGAIQLVDESGAPVTRYPFALYSPDTQEWLAGGNEMIEVLSGTYDLRIESVPLIIMPVTIVTGETLNFPIPGTGTIQLVDESGALTSDYYFTVLDGETGEWIYDTNEPLPILAGNYTVEIRIDPPLVVPAVVTADEITSVTVPPLGTLEILDADGQPTDEYVDIYDTSENLLGGGAGIQYQLPAGIYIVRYSTGGASVEVEIIPGAVTQVQPE